MNDTATTNDSATMKDTTRGYVDLHCHYLPAIDDGVRTTEDGVALCQGLHQIGYAQVVATPHIRTAMFENNKPGLEQALAQFRQDTEHTSGMPDTGLGAEHFFDDVFWSLFQNNGAVPYPGGKAMLVELPDQAIPLGTSQRMFEMRVKGIRPVLAHPERYRPLFKKSDELEGLVRVGALPLLDIMSLAGKYGRKPKRAAERMIKEQLYYAACSDCHRPTDVPLVAEGIDRLTHLVGAEAATAMLSDHPRAILAGTAP